MSQFAQSGSAMDDAQASDGDGGFVGVNQRLQLNQLEVGEVRESLNGRMDGYWKPRRGVLARTGSLVSGTDINYNVLQNQSSYKTDNLICCNSSDALKIKFDFIVCNLP